MRLTLTVCLVVILCGLGTGIILLVRGCDLTAPPYPKYEYGNIIIYCKNKKNVKEFAENLAKFNKALVEKYGDQLHLAKEVKTINIRIFPTKSDFEAYSFRTTHNDYVYNSGFYNPSRNEIALIESDFFNETQKTLYHELTHMLMDLGKKGAEYSAWLSEGTAMYFEESIVNKNIKLGGKNERALDIIKTKSMPLRELLSSQRTVFSTSSNLIYYYQSHLVVYFLIEKHWDKFLNYYNEESNLGPANIKHFEKYFGSIEEVEAEFKEFLETEK